MVYPQPPTHDSGGPTPDAPRAFPHAAEDPVTLLRPTGLVKAGATLQVLTGVITLLVGLQLLMSVTFVDPLLALVPYLWLALGAATVFLGAKTYQMRAWAAVIGVAVTALIMVAMGLWVLLAATAGFFSLLAWVLPLVALMATLFGSLSIGPCLRAGAVRRQLEAEGLDARF